MNNSAYRNGETNKVVFGILLAFAVGSLFGLVVLGWGIYPVTWTDASAMQLRPDLQNDYLRMAIESFLYRPDSGLASFRWQMLGGNAYPVYKAIEIQPQNLKLLDISRFYNAVSQPGGAPQPLPSRLFSTQYCENVTSTAHPLTPGLIFVTAFSLLLSCGLFYVIFFRPHTNPRKKERLSSTAGGPIIDKDKLPQPIGSYAATFAIGGEGYDSSFSINTAAGRFMGDCGVNAFACTTIGDAKVPDAYMLWVYDRMERQMAGVVLATPRAFRNASIRAKLEESGEVFMMEPEQVVFVRTAYLQVAIKINSLMYGDGAYPKGTVQRVDFCVNAWMLNPETIS